MSLMWHEKYAPETVQELIIHKTKIREFDNLLRKFVEKGTPNILVLFGPTGSGKTCLVKATCKNNNLNIMEYVENRDLNENLTLGYDYDLSVFERFKTFISKGKRNNNLDKKQSSQSILLLDELPNINNELILNKFKKLLIEYGIDNTVKNKMIIIYNEANNYENQNQSYIGFNQWYPKIINNPEYIIKYYLKAMPITYFERQLKKIIEKEFNQQLNRSRDKGYCQLFNQLYLDCNADLRAAIIQLQYLFLGVKEINQYNRSDLMTKVLVANKVNNIENNTQMINNNMNLLLEQIFMNFDKINIDYQFLFEKVKLRDDTVQNYFNENLSLFLRDIYNISECCNCMSLLNSFQSFNKLDLIPIFNQIYLSNALNGLKYENQLNQRYITIRIPNAGLINNIKNNFNKYEHIIQSIIYKLNYLDVRKCNTFNSKEFYLQNYYINLIINPTEQSFEFYRLFNGNYNELKLNIKREIKLQLQKDLKLYLNHINNYKIHISNHNDYCNNSVYTKLSPISNNHHFNSVTSELSTLNNYSLNELDFNEIYYNNYVSSNRNQQEIEDIEYYSSDME
ncbi:hypothetical protein K502DRAFT_367449 [Neoconidiobolus thromboides FSU 785]|nr:hypothetical protein K502DRAFT_367449 [Neoconidiobolus thromboides FSU 785]